MTSIGDETSAGVKNLGITWEFLRQRPDKVPGCQEVSNLPDLPEGQISCEEGQRCFYFSCGKCSSILALDTLNFGYKDTMQFVPRITCIPAPETFEEDNKHHGEITEVYLKYLAQFRPGLRGIGINGWSSNNARNIFNNVGETFSGVKKFEKSKDFEIDWILFNGQTITVIEVNERSQVKRGNEGSRERNFESKVDQIKKDRIIMEHLLGVTGCLVFRVNYVIACPNVSISEVIEGRLLENHEQLLQEIVSNGDTLSFISEECMPRGEVYMYNKDDSNLSWINFRELLEPSLFRKTSDQYFRHPGWYKNYRWLASSVILSILVVGNDVNDKNKHLVPDEVNFHLKQNNESRLLRGIPHHARKNFPECVVLGPEQLNAIKDGGDRCLLVGEPGTGKTLILLYLLYKYTAKDLEEKELKKVQFVIPEEKTELFKFLKTFIENNCRVDYVELFQGENLTFWADKNCEIFLLDESVALGDFSFSDTASSKKSQKVYIAAVSYNYVQAPVQSSYTTVYLRHCFRCPFNITNLYMELKHPFPGTSVVSAALHKGAKVNDESDSFKILAYEEFSWSKIYKLLPAKQFPEEKILLVTVEDDTFKLAADENYAQFTPSYCYVESLNTFLFKEKNFSFTGVQYHTVAIIFSKTSFIDSTHVHSLLYHSISRALNRVIILCHKHNYDNLHSLFNLNSSKFQVFDKLRQSQLTLYEDLDMLDFAEDWEKALEILIVTKNTTQFILSAELFNGVLNSLDIFSILIKHFSWGENGEILDMIEELLRATEYTLSMFDFSIAIGSATDILRLSSDIAERRKLLPRFKTLLNDYGIQNENHMENLLFLLHFSIVWADEEWFTLFISSWQKEILMFSKLLRQVSLKMSHTMSEQFNCVVICQQKIFISGDTRCFFEKYSALTKTGRFKYSRDDLTEGFVHMISENHPVDQIFCSRNKTLRSITKWIFWKYIETMYNKRINYCSIFPSKIELNGLLPSVITTKDLAVLSTWETILRRRQGQFPLCRRNEAVLNSLSQLKKKPIEGTKSVSIESE